MGCLVSLAGVGFLVAGVVVLFTGAVGPGLGCLCVGLALCVLSTLSA